MAPGVHVPLRFLRAAIKKGFAIIRTRIATAQHASTRTIVAELQPAFAKSSSRSATSHALERIKVARRWYTTHGRNLLKDSTTSSPATRVKPSRIVTEVGRITTTSPFAATLRPKLGGGAFPRTASGYSIGGGARYFSHGPAAPAQVISQVSAAMRAFLLEGKDGLSSYRRHDGTTGRVGVRAQLAASLAQNGTAPGAYVDFPLAPTFTSISRFGGQTLEQSGLMASLAYDFGHIVADLTAVFGDLKRLATLGDLPISLREEESTIRVRFAGCDREFVERLCDEVGVTRGVIGEDDRFGFELLMPTLDMPPLVPTKAAPHLRWQDMLSTESVVSGTMSGTCDTPSCSGGYLFEGSSVEMTSSPRQFASSDGQRSVAAPPVANYEGLEGIHRFLEQCEDYQAGRHVWASLI